MSSIYNSALMDVAAVVAGKKPAAHIEFIRPGENLIFNELMRLGGKNVQLVRDKSGFLVVRRDKAKDLLPLYEQIQQKDKRTPGFHKQRAYGRILGIPEDATERWLNWKSPKPKATTPPQKQQPNGQEAPPQPVHP